MHLYACMHTKFKHKFGLLGVIFHGKHQLIYLINIFMQNAMNEVKYIIA